MAKTLTIWKADHPVNQCKAIGQSVKKDMQQMSNQDLKDFYYDFLYQMGAQLLCVDAKRKDIMAHCRELAETQFKEQYAERNGFLLFAKWKKMGTDKPASLFHTILETPLWRTYEAWRTMQEGYFKNHIIQVVPHMMSGAVMPEECERPAPPQRPQGWRVFGDPKNHYFLHKLDALVRAITLMEEQGFDVTKREQEEQGFDVTKREQRVITRTSLIKRT